jgi:hypothetical protein
MRCSGPFAGAESKALGAATAARHALYDLDVLALLVLALEA